VRHPHHCGIYLFEYSRIFNLYSYIPIAHYDIREHQKRKSNPFAFSKPLLCASSRKGTDHSVDAVDQYAEGVKFLAPFMAYDD
jgi:hypothetical protein